jgi:hypothetical protein
VSCNQWFTYCNCTSPQCYYHFIFTASAWFSLLTCQCPIYCLESKISLECHIHLRRDIYCYFLLVIIVYEKSIITIIFFEFAQLVATAALFLASKTEESTCLLNTVLRASCEVSQNQEFNLLPYMLRGVSRHNGYFLIIPCFVYLRICWLQCSYFFELNCSELQCHLLMNHLLVFFVRSKTGFNFTEKV